MCKCVGSWSDHPTLAGEKVPRTCAEYIAALEEALADTDSATLLLLQGAYGRLPEPDFGWSARSMWLAEDPPGRPIFYEYKDHVMTAEELEKYASAQELIREYRAGLFTDAEVIELNTWYGIHRTGEGKWVVDEIITSEEPPE